MSDQWMDRLSEYLDGELTAPERRELEAHLGECGECSRTLEDLRDIVGQAEALEDRPPTADLWAGIAERIGAAPGESHSEVDLESRRGRTTRRRRISFSLPQLAAAAVALMILSGALAWTLSRSTPIGDTQVQARDTGAPSPTGSALVADEAFPGYDAAVGELQTLIADSRDELDPQTVRIIEENLRVIDQAIAQARRAVEQDPASVYLNEHLAATMRQKLEFLRHAATMARAAS